MFRKYVKTVWERTGEWMDIFGLAYGECGIDSKMFGINGSPKHITTTKGSDICNHYKNFQLKKKFSLS